MGNTANGLPYPDDTAALAQGAQSIKALASALAVVKTGTVAIGATNSNPKSIAVNFPSKFTKVPLVFCLIITNAISSTIQSAWPTNITVNGFTYNAVRNSSTSLTGIWVAVST